MPITFTFSLIFCSLLKTNEFAFISNENHNFSGTLEILNFWNYLNDSTQVKQKHKKTNRNSKRQTDKEDVFGVNLTKATTSKF